LQDNNMILVNLQQVINNATQKHISITIIFK